MTEVLTDLPLASGPVSLVSQPFSVAVTAVPVSPQAAVAQQLAAAVVTRQDNQVEVSLNPAELGRVRMSIHAQDSVLTLAIQVDRPETADLMRRHAETLATEFRQLGYSNLTLDISSGGEKSTSQGGSGATATPTDQVDLKDDTAAAADLTSTTAPELSGGIDIKV